MSCLYAFYYASRFDCKGVTFGPPLSAGNQLQLFEICELLGEFDQYTKRLNWAYGRGSW